MVAVGVDRQRFQSHGQGLGGGGRRGDIVPERAGGDVQSPVQTPRQLQAVGVIGQSRFEPRPVARPGAAQAMSFQGDPGPRQLGRIQQALHEHHGLQCGFCTPGFVMTIADILRNHAPRGEAEIREALSGNICRCTGYEHIVNAVQQLLLDQERGA